MKKALISLMGIVTVLTLSMGITDLSKTENHKQAVRMSSVGDGGG